MTTDQEVATASSGPSDTNSDCNFTAKTYFQYFMRVEFLCRAKTLLKARYIIIIMET